VSLQPEDPSQGHQPGPRAPGAAAGPAAAPCGNRGRAPSGPASPAAPAPIASPATVVQALAMIGAGLDFLNAADLAGLPSASQGEALAALGGAGAKYTAAHARALAAFTASSGYETDGHFGPVPWLTHVTRKTTAAARRDVAWMRRLAGHPAIADALASETVSDSWAALFCEWTDRLPAADRAGADAILLGAAARGVPLEDLKILAVSMYELSRANDPDPDDGRPFDDRSVRLETTIGGAGRLTGNLSPGCAAALQAVLDALGKNRGAGDLRSQDQRYHDALDEALQLLIGAGMLPDRAGQPTQIQLHIPLSQLRKLPGASEAEATWLAARAGETGYLAGRDAEAAACDATVIPVVTGHVDWEAADRMTQLWIDAHHLDRGREPCGCECGKCSCRPPAPMTGEARARLRRTLLGLAVDALSGEAGLAGYLRAKTLGAQFTTMSLPLDVGHADTVPAAIRRAVILRDKHCRWPGGCDRPAAVCEVHHVHHKADGGPTSVKTCLLLCSFHHQVCIHRWGWTITLQPDGITEARSPWRQVLRSHGPPARPG